MSKLRLDKITDVIAGIWYPWEKRETHICCRCGLRHTVYFKTKDGKVYSKWNVLGKWQMMFGKAKSIETREKISDAKKLYYANKRGEIIQ